MYQLTILLSVAELLLITNEVPLTILLVGADKNPCVPEGVLQLTNIKLPDKTPGSLTTTVPPERYAVPFKTGFQLA